jgi:uncharacterized protein YdaU (DUF1376 family)
MHYYQFNIGDYQSHTSHLSDMEDLAYRRMLDWCYLHEKPLPLEPEDIARQIRLRSHCDSITLVLQEYFERTESGWISERVIKEIEAVGVKKEKASASAKARWNKASHANALPTQSEGNAPITHNTLPITQIEAKASPDLGKPKSVPPAPIQEIVEMYNTILPELPQTVVVNDSRKRAIAARWREVVTADKLDRQGGLDFFRWYFEMVKTSKFLTGKSKDWKADMDFLFNPSKFPRVIEGTYHKEQK